MKSLRASDALKPEREGILEAVASGAYADTIVMETFGHC